MSLIFTAKTFKQNSRATEHNTAATFASTITVLDVELTKIEQSPDRQARPGSPVRLVWEKTFLNAVGRITYLAQSDIYPDDYVRYFKLDFSWARFLIEQVPSRKANYQEILEICQKFGWEPRDMESTSA